MDEFERALKKQHELNTQITGNSDWVRMNLDFKLAMQMEAAEIIDHLGWKWWMHSPKCKKSTLILEVVDIFHFYLSMSIQNRYSSFPEAFSMMPLEQPCTIKQAAKDIMNWSFHPTILMVELVRAVNITLTQLLQMYFAKSVLNDFRQENGYQLGHYRKMWLGREDNEHLAELVLDKGVEEENLFTELSIIYDEVVGRTEKTPRTVVEVNFDI